MADELLIAVAAAVAKGAIDGLAEGGRAAFGALMRLVGRKLDTRSPAQPELSDEARVAALRVALAEEFARDPAFAAEVRRLWTDVEAHRVVGDGNVTNEISGSVGGNAVQARDVQGGISFS